MKVIIVRDITPLDSRTCNSTCVWREGHECSLFLTALAPLSDGPFETRCRRSRECQQAERRGGTWQPKKHSGTDEQSRDDRKGAA